MKSAKEIRQLLNSPAEVGLEYIADPNQYEKEILKGYTMDTVNYGFELDEHCPAKLGQLTVIIGHTNVGKTTVILWLLTKLARAGKRVLIYSAENRISSLHKTITRYYTGRANVSIEDLENVRPFFRYIKHERQFSYKDLLEQSTHLIDAGFDWDFFFIDPYNALKIDNTSRVNSHEYHYEAIEQMRVFTITTNKSIFLNCHTVTEAQREKPDTNGETPVPIMAQVEGGAKFPNKADDVMVVHRHIHAMNEELRYITEIHVAKIRNQEFGGKPTRFSNPLKVKHRIDRTGFDMVGSYESKVRDYKQVSFSESKKENLPF